MYLVEEGYCSFSSFENITEGKTKMSVHISGIGRSGCGQTWRTLSPLAAPLKPVNATANKAVSGLLLYGRDRATRSLIL